MDCDKVKVVSEPSPAKISVEKVLDPPNAFQADE